MALAGCTSTLHSDSSVLGPEIETFRPIYNVDPTDAPAVLRAMLPTIGSNLSPLRRLAVFGKMAANRALFAEDPRSRCEVAQMENVMSPRRLTGFAGIAWVVTTGIGVVLFSLAGTPPEFDDASGYARFVSGAAPLLLSDGFLTGISSVLLVAYLVGFAWLVHSMGNGRSLAPWLLVALGTVTASMLALVGVLETATVYVSSSPSQQGATPSLWLAMNMALVYLYFPAAGALATQAMAVRQTSLLARWTAWLTGGAACLVALASLSIFGGTGDLGPLGTVQVMVGFVPSAIVVLVVSISLLRPLRGVSRSVQSSPLRSRVG